MGAPTNTYNSSTDLSLGQVPQVDDPVLYRELLDIHDAIETLLTSSDGGDATLQTSVDINTTNIATNTTNIATNITNITTNTSDILNLEFRALGSVRSSAYDDTNTTYQVGDFVVNPSANPQKYFKAKELISAPAGTFDATKWQAVNLKEHELRLFSQFGIESPLPYDGNGPTYAKGDYVLNQSLYFKAIEALTGPTGNFDPTKWQQISIKENEERFSTVLGVSNVKDYAASDGYAIGDFVVEPSTNPKLYFKALENIPSPAGAFDPSKWQEVNLKTLITPTDFAANFIGGAVLLAALVADAVASTQTITLADIAAAPVAYDQAFTQTLVDMANDTKAKHNQLVTDLNLVITQFNDLLTKSKTAKQMATT